MVQKIKYKIANEWTHKGIELARGITITNWAVLYSFIKISSIFFCQNIAGCCNFSAIMWVKSERGSRIKLIVESENGVQTGSHPV